MISKETSNSNEQKRNTSESLFLDSTRYENKKLVFKNKTTISNSLTHTFFHYLLSIESVFDFCNYNAIYRESKQRFG